MFFSSNILSWLIFNLPIQNKQTNKNTKLKTTKQTRNTILMPTEEKGNPFFLLQFPQNLKTFSDLFWL